MNSPFVYHKYLLLFLFFVFLDHGEDLFPLLNFLVNLKQLKAIYSFIK